MTACSHIRLIPTLILLLCLEKCTTVERPDLDLQIPGLYQLFVKVLKFRMFTLALRRRSPMIHLLIP